MLSVGFSNSRLKIVGANLSPMIPLGRTSLMASISLQKWVESKIREITVDFAAHHMLPRHESFFAALLSIIFYIKYLQAFRPSYLRPFFRTLMMQDTNSSTSFDAYLDRVKPFHSSINDIPPSSKEPCVTSRWIRVDTNHSSRIKKFIYNFTTNNVMFAYL